MRRDVRLPLRPCPWYSILHLEVQTCVHRRIPRLLRMAASNDKSVRESQPGGGSLPSWLESTWPLDSEGLLDCPQLVGQPRLSRALSHTRVNSNLLKFGTLDLNNYFYITDKCPFEVDKKNTASLQCPTPSLCMRFLPLLSRYQLHVLISFSHPPSLYL